MSRDTKRCASETMSSDTTFGVYECPVDRRPCEVLEPLRKRLSGEVEPAAYEEFVGDIADWLPCRDCRLGEREAGGLVERSVRLGRHERRILLSAPAGSKGGWRDDSNPPTYPADGLVVWPGGSDRAAEEAHRRALRKLQRVGLVELYASSAGMHESEEPAWAKLRRVRSRYWVYGWGRYCVRLTPLGERLVEAYRTELEHGLPVRWGKCLDGVLASIHRPVNELLDLLLRGGVGRGLFFGAASAQFASAVGKRIGPELARQKQRRTETLKKARAAIQEIRDGGA